MSVSKGREHSDRFEFPFRMEKAVLNFSQISERNLEKERRIPVFKASLVPSAEIKDMMIRNLVGGSWIQDAL